MKKILVLCISILLLCTGCLEEIAHHYQEKDAKEKEEIREKALPMAKQCLSKKYNFTLVESDIDEYSYPCNFSVPFGCDGLSGDLDIKAHHDGINYKMHINTNRGVCSDNYEKKDIVLKVKKYLSDTLGINESKMTVYVHGVDFLNQEKVDLTQELPVLLPYATKVDLITYESINDNKVNIIADYFEGRKITFKLLEAKDGNSYNTLLSKLDFNGEEYSGYYSYLDNPDNLLKGYYEINDSNYNGKYHRNYYGKN